jgi:hypothetical protein
VAKTRLELKERALKNLGVLAEGQTAATEDLAEVDDHIDPLLAELTDRDIFYVVDDEAIDDSAFLSLGHCLAWACAAQFGAQADPALAALAQQAEMKLKNIASEGPTYRALKVQAF